MRSRHSAHQRQLLAQRAACMRREPTASELALWSALCGSRLGVAFRRQVVIGGYIVDFCAPSVRLIVEVDGAWHRGRERKDAHRQRVLEARAWRVVRVEAREVLADLEAVVERVRGALG